MARPSKYSPEVRERAVGYLRRERERVGTLLRPQQPTAAVLCDCRAIVDAGSAQVWREQRVGAQGRIALEGDIDEQHIAVLARCHAQCELEALVGELQLESRVHFTGELVDATNLHQFFDVSVLCSRSEGFPNTVIEALAAGCPVVATPVGGVPEVVVDRRTGLLVPPGDPIALAQAIEELMRDPGLRQRMGAAGVERIQKNFTLSEMTVKMEQLFEETISAAKS